MWWSPNGDHALVLSDDRLYLVTTDGELGPPLTEKGLMDQVLVKQVSWLPDGSGFVCQRMRMVSAWTDTQALLSAEEVSAVDKLLPTVPLLLQAAQALGKTGATLEEITTSMPMLGKVAFMTALRRAYLEEPAKIEALLSALPKGADIIDSLKKKDAAFEVQEVCLIRLTKGHASEPACITRSLLRPPLLPRVSPKYPAVALARISEDEKTATLEVRSLDGTASLTVARNVSRAFAWAPDGRTLIFMAPLGDEAERLQTLHRSTVLLENGSLMKPRQEGRTDGTSVDIVVPDRLQEPATLATVVSFHQPALEVLADGRILFASQQLSLPALSSGTEQPQSQLFMLSANGKDLKAVPTTSGDLPANLAYFTASPDGKRVAVVEGETDTVAVVSLDSGATQIVSPPHPRWQCRTIPAWKSSTELTFAALDGEAQQPKWMIWSPGHGLRCISLKWPATATESWLERKSDPPTVYPGGEAGRDKPLAR